MELPSLTVVFMLGSGIPLTVISVRRFGFFGTFFDENVRDELAKPIDAVDRRLLLVSALCFVAFLYSLSGTH